MIIVKNLSVYLADKDGGEQILSDIDFRLEKGRSLSIVGPSGCGKTTLLHAIAGLNEDNLIEGSIQLTHGDAETTLVLQRAGLLPWKTVWQNATLGLELRGERDMSKAERLLRELGLEQYKEDFPMQLSGGQRRLLGLVRALAVEPALLLMDEPLVSLDEFTRSNLQDTILKLWKREGVTMIMVTHDVEEAVYLGERIMLLAGEPASIRAVVDNPGMGTEDFRRSEEFYKVVKTVREGFYQR